LLLSRPNQHVARRGSELAADPAALLDLVRGAGQSVIANTKRRPGQ
jgi:hypothetical protein